MKLNVSIKELVAGHNRERVQKMKSGRLPITGGIVIILAGFMILFILSLWFLSSGGYISLPEPLAAVFGGSSSGTDRSSGKANEIVFADSYYNDENTAQAYPVNEPTAYDDIKSVLSALPYPDRTYRITYSVSGNGEPYNITVIRSGNRISYESDDRNVSFDGETLTVTLNSAGQKRSVEYAGQISDVTAETGVYFTESLADVLGEEDFTFDEGSKRLSFTFYTDDGAVEHDMVFDYEKGVVVSDVCMKDGIKYYSITMRSSDFGYNSEQ